MYNIYNEYNYIIYYINIVIAAYRLSSVNNNKNNYNINVINSLIIDISIFILNITVGTYMYIARLL